MNEKLRHRIFNRRKTHGIIFILFALIILNIICLKMWNVKNNSNYNLYKNAKKRNIVKIHQNNELRVEDLFAKAAVLIDGNSGRVLFSKNGNQKLPMASTTKIMTLIIALENANLSQVVSISSYAASMPKVALGLKEGEQYYLEDLLYSMMLESHNDSAVAIAETVAGNVEIFARMMNKKAVEIGCENTYFITPNGLDDKKQQDDVFYEHGSSGADMAKILRYCMCLSSQKDNFIKITTTQKYIFKEIESSESKIVTNHNSYLNMDCNASSGKTGFTTKAGYCYVGSVIDKDRILIVALLACGWPGNKHYKWHDMRKLVAYGRSCYRSEVIVLPDVDQRYVLVRDGYYVGDKTNLNSISKKDVTARVYIKDADLINSSKILLKNDYEKIDYILEVKPLVYAPVIKNQKAGILTIRIGDDIVYQLPVLFGETLLKRNVKWYWEYIIYHLLD